MTAERTKAIKELEYVKKQTGYADIALDMAIKALEQQPYEDCISREALLNSLKGFEILHNHDELRSNLIYGIMNLPSVTPQQKMGRWINNKCDKCGASRPPLFDNYCPNCGAKMEVEK